MCQKRSITEHTLINKKNCQYSEGIWRESVVYITLIMERLITEYIDKIQGLINIKITFIETVFVRNDTTDRHMGCERSAFMVTSLRTGCQPIGYSFPGRGKIFLHIRSFHIGFGSTHPLLSEYLQQNECDTKLTAPFCLTF